MSRANYRASGADNKPIIFLIILLLLIAPTVGSISNYSTQELFEDTQIKEQIPIEIIEPFYNLFNRNTQASVLNNGYNYTDVLVVYNENSALSIQIAQYFQNARDIPNINMCNITTSTAETADMTEFQNIRIQIESHMEDNNITDKINYIVTTKDVPLRVSGGTNSRACLDNELALIKGQYQGSIGGNGWLINPYFQDDEPFSREKYDFFLVTRLTGFTWPEIKGLIDNATICQGKRGIYMLDVDATKGYTGGYGIGNVWIRDANTILTGKGEQTQYDNTNTFLTGGTNIMGYASWGSNDAHYRTNFLKNDGFESSMYNLTDWEIIHDTGITDNVSVNYSVRYYHQNSLMINRTTTSNNISGVAQNVNVIPGQRYYLTGYVNITSISGVGGAHLQFQLLDASDNILQIVNSNFRTAVTNDWVAFSQRLVEPTLNTAKIRVLVLMNQSSGVAFFDRISLLGMLPHNYWVPGSIAETFVSTGGRSFNYGTTYGQSLVVDLIRDGVSGVKGYVYEPYLSAIAHPDILFDRYTDGYNMAESYYMASNFLSWMDVVVGDPKMAPYDDRITDLNISVNSIKFVPKIPNQDQEITFKYTVHNLGNSTIETLIAKTFMITDTEEILINEKTITDILANVGAEKVQFMYTPEEILGDVTIQVVVDPDNKIKETDEYNNIAEKILHINYVPVALDLKIENGTINRTDKFVLYANASDFENSTSELTPILESKHEDRESWLQFSDAQSLTFYNSQDARWQFEITTNASMDVGKYSFRLQFLDGNLAMSNYVYCHDTLLINNLPIIDEYSIDKLMIYRNNTITLECKASDIETKTENLIIEMQYQHIPLMGTGKGWVYLENIEYDSINDSWRATLDFNRKAKVGAYEFRAWAIDEEKDESVLFQMPERLQVLNNQPFLLELEPGRYSVLRTQETGIIATGSDLEDKNRLDSFVCWINYTYYLGEGEPPNDYSPPVDAVWVNEYLDDIKFDYDINGWITYFKPPKDASLGFYYFRVKIKDLDDNWSESLVLDEPVKVLNNKPEAKISKIPITIFEDQKVTFDASKSKDMEDEFNDLKLQWVLTDEEGQDIVSTNESFTFTSSFKGDYTMNLTVTDKDGASNSKEILFSIVNVKPTASVKLPTTRKFVNEVFEISAEESTDSVSDIDSLTYTWDFGDGTTGTGIKVNHSYPEAKTYSLTLTVTDDDGDSVIFTTTIRIYPMEDTTKPGSDDAGTEGVSMAVLVGIAVIIVIIIIIILFLLLRKRKPTEVPDEPEQTPVIQEPWVPQIEQQPTIQPTMDVPQEQQEQQETIENIPLEEKAATEELGTIPQEPVLDQPELPPLLPEAASTTEIDQQEEQEMQPTGQETPEKDQETDTERKVIDDENIQEIN